MFPAGQAVSPVALSGRRFERPLCPGRRGWATPLQNDLWCRFGWGGL